MTKEEALNIILRCAEQYKNNLVNRNLLFICIDSALKVHSFEVVFAGSNFLHMTGVKFLSKPVISPNAFYSRCIDKRLSVKDFDMDGQGHTEQKLMVLSQLVKANLSANAIGDYNSARPFLATDKLAGGVKCCMGFVADGKRTPFFVPNSVLNEDIRKLSNNRLRIAATYRKKVTDTDYREIVFRAKNIEWAKLRYPSDWGSKPKPEESA